MRIALVSPYSTRSAISSWARLIAEDLAAKHHELTIIRAESALPDLEAPLALPALPAPCPVLVGRNLPPAALAGFDIVVYALGNHCGHHMEVPRLLRAVPGVVVMHDADMSGFLHGWRHAAPAPDVPPLDAPHDAILEWFGARATGAIVHARFYAAPLQRACPGPVAAIRLPFFDLGIAPPRPRSSLDPMLVATLGDANDNKRHRAVIEAIAREPALQAHATYRVLGRASPDQADRLHALATHLGVRLELMGWLDDAALRAAMAEIDVFCCLRHPVTEGASASAVVGLLSARPVIVSATGSFLDLPEDLVLRVPAGAELPALTQHLMTLLHHPAHGHALGAAARAWAREAFIPSHYTDRMLPLLERARAWAPVTGVLHALADEAARLGLPLGDPSLTAARAALDRTFGAAALPAI